MIKTALTALFKPQALAVLKYVGAGIALAISAGTIISRVEKSIDARFTAYELRSEQRQKTNDSIQNANYQRLFLKIINKLEDLDSTTNKNAGFSRELIEAKKENFILLKENMNLKSLSEKKNYYQNLNTSYQFPGELTLLSTGLISKE